MHSSAWKVGMFNWGCRCPVLLTWLFLLGAPQSVWAAAASEIIGTWEGQSLCTVPNSPCHDEHVVYHVRNAEHSGGNLVIAAYKVVNGEEEFMGNIACQHSGTLSCTAHTRQDDDWEFHVADKHMSGTLVIGKQKTLYRKVSVDRRPA